MCKTVQLVLGVKWVKKWNDRTRCVYFFSFFYDETILERKVKELIWKTAAAAAAANETKKMKNKTQATKENVNKLFF